MKLCVLMPVHNEAKYIGSAIASILAARDPLEIEIIIVDDGSTDTTVDIVKKISATTAGIQLITTENRGVAHARNTLLAAIPKDCDAVTFLDGDDAFEAGYLQKHCDILERDPTLDLVYGNLCTIQSDEQDLSLAPRDKALISRTISMAIGLYRPEILARVGQFEAKYVQSEDTDFLLRLFELGPKAHLTEDIALLYRQHKGNMTKDITVARRSFARAMLAHIMRRKANPGLASVEHVFSITQMGSTILEKRAP